MLKLYRRDGDGHLYWEAWDAEGAVAVHRGIVGTEGETLHLPLAEGENPSHRIWLESAGPRGEGFAERPVHLLDRVTLAVPALARLDQETGAPAWPLVERMLTQALGSRGLGHCAGVEPAARVFHVLTVDPTLAQPLLRAGLEDEGLGAGLEIMVERARDERSG